jgi:phytoene dehydrogenase-like protein
MAIREDVMLKKADAKGAIILFTRKKAHWEEKAKEAEARFTDTCRYFIHVYTKNIEYFQNLSSLQEQRAEPAPEAVGSIAAYYPQFQKHYSKLADDYIRPTDNGLQWLKTKQSLAEYFDAIKPESKRHNWIILENVFDTKDLKNSLSNNGNSYSKKPSKDFEELQKLLCLENTPRSK